MLKKHYSLCQLMALKKLHAIPCVLSSAFPYLFFQQILQECPEQPEAFNEMERFDEIEAVGKSLLDRLTVPVVYPDGSEQYFGSPSDMASAAEHIREKMKLVSLKRQQLRQPEATTPES
uniref:Uncharacterized protein n=1 Tax=Accipiter nisus TaxID=211598 RepID=A0A8B9MY83_9AVES